jgi:hypothetical protein
MNTMISLPAILTAMLLCLPTALASGKSPQGDVVGKVTVGYQGWFACPGDGSPINAWWHWSPDQGKPPSPDNIGIHCWPDMRQYAKHYQTAFANLGNGQPAALFSSCDDQVIQTHFRWLSEYGIDCAALQRFNPDGGEGPTRNIITKKVMAAAEIYDRKFYIMYDISGWNKFSTEMEKDWKDVIVGQMHLTSSSAYAKQNGKPVVCIWGMGFNDPSHDFDAATCIDVINWFKSQGCYVIGGVPTHWRTEDGDSRPDFLRAYENFDMISPWMVGRIGKPKDSDWFCVNVNEADVEFCHKRGIDYQPCVLPGDKGQRIHGDFMWRQFTNLIGIGSDGLYISMFDEYNEGNQIAPTAEDASMSPTGTSQFFTLDEDGVHCSSDYYLRLTDDGGRMLKHQIPLTLKRFTPPMPPNSTE